MSIEIILQWLDNYPYLAQIIKGAAVLSLSFISYFITRHFIVRVLSKLTLRTKTQLDDILLKKEILNRTSYISPLIVMNSFAYLFPSAENIISKLSITLVAFIVLLITGLLLNAFHEIYLSLDMSQGRPIKGYIQVVKLILYLLGGIIIISSLLGKSPLVLLSGFGAMTAVILLIFRDTILSLLASLQISSNDLVRVGDWIEAPKYKADGDVVDIALHTIKIQNFDKTFTIIPTHKLIEETFKNWRGMKKSGGRRIKRSLCIDMTSICFCNREMIKRFKNIHLISNYMANKETEINLYNKEHHVDINTLANGRRLTNIGTFRAYISAYLNNHNKIHQKMTFIVRQLPPGPTGLPLEIYVFASDIVWANYEAIQSDIFDHIIAVLPEFGLRIFQNPTGHDFTSAHTSRLSASNAAQIVEHL